MVLETAAYNEFAFDANLLAFTKSMVIDIPGLWFFYCLLDYGFYASVTCGTSQEQSKYST